MARILKLTTEKDIRKEFARIGVDSAGIKIMVPKGRHLNILVDKVDARAANIIKQEMLSLGAEAALPKQAYLLTNTKTDIIISGTERQIKSLVGKLSRQIAFGLPETGRQISQALANYQTPLKRKIGSKIFDFGKRAYLMGILNVTPDSFSDGGQFFNKEAAIKHIRQMVADGADIIDVGGESTRPGSKPVSVKDETKRVIPVIKAVASKIKVPVSIDTSKPEVANEALKAGASMVNDVTGLRNPKMLKFVAKKNVPTIIMHMKGEPRTMQEKPVYEDVVSDIYAYLKGQADKAFKAGLSKENIYIDFGIGFGKTLEHNVELIRRLEEFKSMGYPVVYGSSRKSFIGMILDLPVDQRLEGTAASVALGIANGAAIVRVHDVKEMKRVLQVTEAIIGR